MNKFIRKKEALEKIYKSGISPNPSELRGIYKITMLTGFLPDLSRFGHVKQFYHLFLNVSGYNMFDYWFKWGYFRVYLDNKKSPPETVINYNQKKNWVSKKIIDTIVTVTPNQLYLGKFHYVIFGKRRFIGYFEMEKQG